MLRGVSWFAGGRTGRGRRPWGTSTTTRPRSRSSPPPVGCSRALRGTLRRHVAHWDAVLASGDTWLSAREALDAWHDDRALVAAYEGYADEHADLYQDDRTRLALGKGTTADSERAVSRVRPCWRVPPQPV